MGKEDARGARQAGKQCKRVLRIPLRFCRIPFIRRAKSSFYGQTQKETLANYS